MGRVLLGELGPSRAQESGTHLGEGRSGGAGSGHRGAKVRLDANRFAAALSGQGARLGLSPLLGPALVTSAGPRGNGGSQNLASISRLEKWDRKLDKSKLT